VADQPSSRFGSRAVRWLVLPLLLYTLAVIFITWPLASQLATHVGGGGFGDSFEYVRLGWWGEYALKTGANPFYQSLLLYPGGFFSPTQIAQPLIYWPISALSFFVGPVAGFNLWLMLETILSGLTAYWLCRMVLRDSPAITPAALLGGLIFMAFPTVQGHLSAGHVNPLSNYALPVVVMCLLRILESPRTALRWSVLGAISLLILALGNFTFLVYSLLPILVFGAIYILCCNRYLLKRDAFLPLLRNLVLMLGLGAVLILPFYLPLITESLSPDRPAYLQESGFIRYSTDPLAFFAPSPFTPWSAIAPEYSRAVLGTNSAEGAAYLGILPLLLALVALWRPGSPSRRPWLWALIGLGCMLFALGPILKWRDQPVLYTVGDYQSSIVLPWALFQNLPLVNITRTPGRFNFTTGLMLAILASIGASALLARISRSRRAPRLALSALAFVAILLDYQLFLPFPTTPAALPRYFTDLAARSDVRAVLDVPVIAAQKDAMFQQTVHHKPLIAGYVTRGTTLDSAVVNVLSDVALNRAFSATDQGLQPLSAPESRLLLAENNIDVLIYHWAFAPKADIYPSARDRFGAPLYEDDNLAIFEVHAAADSAIVRHPVLTFGDNRPGRDGLGIYWLGGQMSFSVYIPPSAQPADQTWSLDLWPIVQPRGVFLSIDNTPASRAWTLAPASVPLTFWTTLAPGFHTLRLTTPDPCLSSPVPPARLLADSPCAQNPEGCTMPDSASSVCVTLALRSLRLSDSTAFPFTAQSIQLGEGMQFLGYRLPSTIQRGTTLSVDTIWRASQKLPGDYHLFVHVLNASGAIITQDDIIPGRGLFPTTRWSAPQPWSETARLSLPADLPTGPYTLLLGWYRYPDLTRLSVPNSPDGVIHLATIKIQ